MPPAALLQCEVDMDVPAMIILDTHAICNKLLINNL